MHLLKSSLFFEYTETLLHTKTLQNENPSHCLTEHTFFTPTTAACAHPLLTVHSLTKPLLTVQGLSRQQQQQLFLLYQQKSPGAVMSRWLSFIHARGSKSTEFESSVVFCQLSCPCTVFRGLKKTF